MEPQKNNSKKSVSSGVSLLRYTDIVFRMAATIGLGTWLGKWLDGKMQMEKPIFLPVFALVAVAAALYFVIQDANKIK
jgi:F0F1-type ATP synthase assembly protein I